jgi:ribosome recycling factor
LVRKKAEEGRVAIRNLRREANEEIRTQEREGQISEDQARKAMEAIQKLTDRYIGEIDAILRSKEEEITAV